MLGEAESDFDVALVTLQTYQPTEYYLRLALQGRATLEEVAQRPRSSNDSRWSTWCTARW